MKELITKWGQAADVAREAGEVGVANTLDECAGDLAHALGDEAEEVTL